MKKSKQPGPWDWEVSDYSMAFIQGANGEEDHVLSVSTCEKCGCCVTPTFENAALICTAPELLAACKWAYELLETGKAKAGCSEALRRVISKAEGKLKK